MTRKSSPVATRVAGLFERSDTQAPERSDVQTSKRVKKTVYISRDADVLLTQLQLDRLKETGDKPELSELVNEAILLLGQRSAQAS